MKKYQKILAAALSLAMMLALLSALPLVRAVALLMEELLV